MAVIVCAYTMARRFEVLACIDSLTRQSRAPTETIVVIDHKPQIERWLASRLPDDVRIVAHDGPCGLSGARNTGIRSSSQPIVAFLDDDAVAEPDCIRHPACALVEPGVIAAGGRFAPALGRRAAGLVPGRVPLGRGLLVPRDGPRRIRPQRARRLYDVPGGALRQGRRLRPRRRPHRPRPVGGEEAELCIRALRAWERARIVLVDGARMHHRVPRQRQRPAYFAKRCFHEGVSRALIRRLGGGGALATERSYAARTLPRAIVRELVSGLRHGHSVQGFSGPQPS